MSETEILERLRLLPKEKQAEIVDFLDYLVRRYGAEHSWTEPGFREFGFQLALRGMEDDPVAYTPEDIRRPWQ